MDDSGVIIVDLGPHPLDDPEAVRRLRKWTRAPIIVLSSQGRGARVRCPGQGGPVRIGDAVVDLTAKRITRRPPEGEVRLTPTEWHLLEMLLRSPGRLLSQQQLLAAVWGPGYDRATGNLRLYMAQLRRKLEPDPSRPRWLVTEPGLGYCFQPGPPDASASRAWRYRPAPTAGRHQCCRIRPHGRSAALVGYPAAS